MDTYRAFLAIIISFIILVGYQYLFVGFDQPVAVDEQTEQRAPQEVAPSGQVAANGTSVPAVTAQMMPPVQPVSYDRAPKEVIVETDLYTATLSEDGGTVTSFVLKNYKETHDADSLGMELVKTDATQGFPLEFSWGSALPGRILYTSDVENVILSKGQDQGQLVLTADAGNGLTVVRT
jgi:YidC/Oxa1 family membrane protein insertase